MSPHLTNATTRACVRTWRGQQDHPQQSHHQEGPHRSFGGERFQQQLGRSSATEWRMMAPLGSMLRPARRAAHLACMCETMGLSVQEAIWLSGFGLHGWFDLYVWGFGTLTRRSKLTLGS